MLYELVYMLASASVTLAFVAVIMMFFAFKPIFSKLSRMQKVTLVAVEVLTIFPWLYGFISGFLNY